MVGINTPLIVINSRGLGLLVWREVSGSIVFGLSHLSFAVFFNFEEVIVFAVLVGCGLVYF